LDKVLAFILICVSTLCAQRVEELVTAGDALDEKHRNSEALSLYLKADAQKPNDAEILQRLSKQYAELMRLDPKNDYAWHLLGRWNYALGNFKSLFKSSCPGDLRKASRCLERKGR
jgi:hypothetical protein